MRRGLAATTVGVVLSLGLAACSADEPTPPKGSPSTSKPNDGPRRLTFGAFGHPDELKAFEQVVDSFNASSQTRKVELITWRDQQEALDAVLGGEVPDVFMTSRSDLYEIAESESTRPVSLLLDERGVDFGDRYSRDALEAFSYDDELQCMPYSVSPMVIYYNDDLIDFAKMERRDLDVPVDAEGELTDRWTIEEFAAAAEFATRRRNVDAVWIEPTLSGLAPFIYSGEGQVLDDQTEPTSLAFSDDGTRAALEQTLAILRDATLTPSPNELRKATALQLFKRGKLAMVAGYRDLVPELRAVERLSFDTISMPVIETPATVGDADGLCISAETEDVNDAADFLAYAVSDAAIDIVTRTGYIVPANTEVAGSEAFLWPGREPAHASVFNAAIRGMVVPPLLPDRPELDEAVAPLVEGLVMSPGILELDAATEEIDLVSQTILDPESVTESPSESATE
ncbi:MAG: carbohydrate transporter substrate-binding protein family [Nocardioides sp.]|jgi:multiple sugar transport system substrate-binding protein|uniref:ABC transporter substrate-binding protein n=1 Tax=Nocardioides sp. TaxID=35761 RepID=UPI0026254863|nr:extracellular solute-binding protein [Nocardioides sp.]MCW2833413.1 carbohydrate transporter substrate-binding protein family [Nocardioides sp.]